MSESSSLVERLYQSGAKKTDLTHTPDVLSCLANLSNDEVFTGPEVVNQMLDMLPQELFSDPNTKFLDPACKTGVFLREIAKRLLVGLEPIYPDLQERIDHIFHKQIYGIAITELTSLLSRRSVYCSKYPNGRYSICHFDNSEGNIRFKKIKHTWENGQCKYCGASQSQYDRSKDKETHAYEFIHGMKVEDVFKMRFDVIISNPPYQLSDGGGMGTSSVPLYNSFIEKAKSLNPRYLTMIIPARWYSGGKGLDDFRNEMLKDNHLSKLVDYFDSKDCFPGVDISGGVCYFLWEREYAGKCEVTTHFNNQTVTMKRPLLESGRNTFVRFNEAVSIVRKVADLNEDSFEKIVSVRRPFGLDPKLSISTKGGTGYVKVYAWPENGFIHKSDIIQNKDAVDNYKVFIAKAYGERGSFPYLVTGKPFLGEKNSCCTETYLLIGNYPDKGIAQNVISYMTTKFFRFLVLIKKNTQNAPKGVYEFVPMQDFSKPWTDEELYKKYNLSKKEIEFIDSMIRPMEV